MNHFLHRSSRLICKTSFHNCRHFQWRLAKTLASYHFPDSSTFSYTVYLTTFTIYRRHYSQSKGKKGTIFPLPRVNCVGKKLLEISVLSPFTTEGLQLRAKEVFSSSPLGSPGNNYSTP